mgnify:CR=1 FL=1
MRKLLDRVYDGALGLAALFLVGIFVLMVSESVLRYFGSYITGAQELVGWFCAAAGFLALPATFKRGEVIRVGIVVDALPGHIRKPALIACMLIAVVCVGYMFKATSLYIWQDFKSEEVTQGMIEVATWIPQTSLLVGVVLLFVVIIDEFIVALRSPASVLRAERAMSTEDLTI